MSEMLVPFPASVAWEAMQRMNPYDQALLESFNALADANTALDSTTIAGRVRIRLARARCDSVKAAHRRWHEEDQ